jgi:hypothetical protein
MSLARECSRALRSARIVISRHSRRDRIGAFRARLEKREERWARSRSQHACVAAAILRQEQRSDAHRSAVLDIAARYREVEERRSKRVRRVHHDSVQEGTCFFRRRSGRKNGRGCAASLALSKSAVVYDACKTSNASSDRMMLLSRERTHAFVEVYRIAERTETS